MARDKKDIIKDGEGTQFGKGQPTNLGGRKKSTLNALIVQLKEEGYERATATEVVEAYELLIGLPLDKLNELANNSKQIAIIRHLAFLLYSKDNKRAFDIMEKMLDRAHGKAIQTKVIEGNMTIETNQLSELTNEQLKSIKILLSESNDTAKE